MSVCMQLRQKTIQHCARLGIEIPNPTYTLYQLILQCPYNVQYEYEYVYVDLTIGIHNNNNTALLEAVYSVRCCNFRSSRRRSFSSYPRVLDASFDCFLQIRYKIISQNQILLQKILSQKILLQKIILQKILSSERSLSTYLLVLRALCLGDDHDQQITLSWICPSVAHIDRKDYTGTYDF